MKRNSSSGVKHFQPRPLCSRERLMRFVVLCRGCQRKLRISERLAGRIITCPQCACRMVFPRTSKANGAALSHALPGSQQSGAAPARKPRPGRGAADLQEQTPRPAQKTATSVPDRVPAPKKGLPRTEIPSSKPVQPTEQVPPAEPPAPEEDLLQEDQSQEESPREEQVQRESPSRPAPQPANPSRRPARSLTRKKKALCQPGSVSGVSPASDWAVWPCSWHRWSEVVP